MRCFDHQYIARRTWTINSDDFVVLDLQACQFYTPIGLTYLAGFLHRCVDRDALVNLTFQREVLNYLERIGFFDYIDNTFHDAVLINPTRPQIHKTPLHNQLVEFQGIAFWELEEIDAQAEHLAQVTSMKADSNAPYDYFYNIYVELLDNAFFHSKAPEAQVIAQTYPELVKISISDHGIGIPQRLSEKYTFPSDHDAIVLATDKNVTTQNRRWGTGLTTMRQYLQDPQDYLFIASNNGCVTFSRNNQFTKHGRFRSDFSGTYIEMCLKRHSKYRQNSQEELLPF